jgi:choline monooxygenase
MSDIGRRAHWQPSNAQLPVSAYFDATLYQHEIATLFKCGPGYAGHALMTPQPGDFFALPAENEGRLLVHHEQGIELISNVCRHRQAKMLTGRGHVANIVCPIHRWTYDLKGQLLGAPHFKEQPCLNLPRTPLQNWRGLLFSGQRSVLDDLRGLPNIPEFDFSGFQLDHVEVHECAYNWKTFIEVYLEDYHVEPFHPGLGKFVECAELDWHFGPWWSVQTVGVHRALNKPGSAVYRRWHEEVLKFGGGTAPRHGAIWLTYYPNLMVEWYPHVLVVSHLVPKGPRQTTNIIEFYYPEEIVLFERDFIEAERAAYMETCIEDDEIAMRMDAGRQVLYERGDNQVGPYQSPMEDGMQHFHEFLRQHLPIDTPNPQVDHANPLFMGRGSGR